MNNEITTAYEEIIEDYFNSFPEYSIPINYLDEVYNDSQKSNHWPARKHLALVDIVNNKPSFKCHALEGGEKLPYGRFKTALDFIKKLTRLYKFEDTKFLLFTADSAHVDFPCFGVIRSFHSDLYWPNLMIPFPLGNANGMNKGWGSPIVGWDDYVKKNIVQIGEKYPWESKINKTAWRGSFKMITWAAGKFSKKKIKSWKDCTRAKLYLESKDKGDIFDIGITSIADKNHNPELPVPDEVYKKIEIKNSIHFAEMQKYKAILVVGNVCDWCERVRGQLFMNSVMVLQDCDEKAREFFYNLLEPYVHYVPVKGDLSDLHEVGKWIVNNDSEVKKIIKNANEFARKYLCEESTYEYGRLAIEKYTRLLKS